MSLPKRDGVHDRYYLIHKPDTSPEVLAEADLCILDAFTGLKIKELAWFENPREKTLKNGKPRARRAKWLPDREVDLVYLYSDRYLDARNPSPAETDFFTVTRMDAWGVSTWFMCTPEAAEKLIAMNYDNLAVKETTIVG